MRIALYFFTWASLCCYSAAFGQKPEHFVFQTENVKIDKSFFSSVEVTDARFDTVYMGFVQKGAFNHKAPIQLVQSMPVEIMEATSKIIAGAVKQNRTILILVRNFFLSELTTATSETGTFTFEAGCYLKDEDNSYRTMFTVDTIMVVRALDVTKKLLGKANEQFKLFIQRAALYDTSELGKISYSRNQLQNIDETEKKMIPVYNVDVPQKGLYATFQDFKNNTPTETKFIEEFNKKTEPLFFYMNDDSSKGKEVTRTHYYAICDGNILFISTEHGLYPARKKDHDFYFVGKAKEASNTSSVAMASFMFGIVGGMLASIPETATFEFKIDHVTGKFLPIKRVSN